MDAHCSALMYTLIPFPEEVDLYLYGFLFYDFSQDDGDQNVFSLRMRCDIMPDPASVLEDARLRSCRGICAGQEGLWKGGRWLRRGFQPYCQGDDDFLLADEGKPLDGRGQHCHHPRVYLVTGFENLEADDVKDRMKAIQTSGVPKGDDKAALDHHGTPERERWEREGLGSVLNYRSSVLEYRERWGSATRRPKGPKGQQEELDPADEYVQHGLCIVRYRELFQNTDGTVSETKVLAWPRHLCFCDIPDYITCIKPRHESS